MYDIPAQLIGAVAAAIIIGSFQCKDSRWLFFFQALGAMLFSVHFALLGASTGFLLNIVALARGAILYFSNKKWARSPFWLAALLLAFTLAVIFTWDGVLSIIPGFAMLAGTCFMWTANGKKIRYAQLFLISPFWLFYNISVLSYAGIFTETFNIISVTISLIRFRNVRLKKLK